MANSKLATYRNITPNNSGKRTKKITKITIHFMVAQWTGKQCADYFVQCAKEGRRASANYCIGVDGDIAISVDEDCRAWTSSSEWNDQQAITIECANLPDSSLTDATYKALIALCADICERYNIDPHCDGTKNGTLTLHRYFAITNCPGEWLTEKITSGEVEKDIKAFMGKAPGTAQTALYRVQVGAYSKKSNADQMASKLKAAGFPVFVTQVNNLYKVQTGAYSKKENAVNQLNALKSKGFEGFIISPTSEKTEAKPIETKPKEEESTMKFKYADSLYDIPKKWRDYAVERTDVGFPNCFGLATAYASWMAGYKQPLDPDNKKVRGAGDLWKTHHPNFKQSSSPVLGALMIWTGGGENYGHVAVCIGINGNTITWLESNYSEKVGAPMSDVVARNPHGYAGLTFKGYLVHKDLSKTTIKPASNTKKTKNINGFDCIPENGTATFKYSVNVRDGSPTGKVVAVYDPGEYANYQYKYIGNGHRYIVYKSNSGSWRFVAVSGTEKQGEDPWATFK